MHAETIAWRRPLTTTTRPSSSRRRVSRIAPSSDAGRTRPCGADEAERRDDELEGSADARVSAGPCDPSVTARDTTTTTAAAAARLAIPDSPRPKRRGPTLFPSRLERGGTG